MPENNWIRIPCPIETETDRRELVAILAAAELECRIVRCRATPKSPVKRFVEYRRQT